MLIFLSMIIIYETDIITESNICFKISEFDDFFVSFKS